MVIERTSYKCEMERCKKIYLTRKTAVAHEKRCIFNPDRHSCPTCEYDRWTEEPVELCVANVQRRRDKSCIVDCTKWRLRTDDRD